MSAWETIASAPMDGTDVLIWKPGHLVVIGRWTGHGYYGGPGWFSAWFNAPMRDTPTHWQPVPAPPDLERAAADLWRKENPDKSVFACDVAEKERYRERVRKGERP